jgi:hypothetical protein
LEAYVDRTSPRDLFALMYDHGYRLYDIFDLHYRPFDDALTGGDLFFAHHTSRLRAHKGWA